MRGPDLGRHLTTLADLHVAGALSADEFALAKQRLRRAVGPPNGPSHASHTGTLTATDQAHMEYECP